MNKFSQILLSATAGSLVTLAFTLSPLFAQNKPATPAPASHPHPTAENSDHQKIMNEMSEMMARCKEKMSNHNKAAGSEHSQNHPSPTNSASDSTQSSQIKE